MSIEIRYKGELLGRIDADPIQDSFPWYEGTFTPAAAFAAYRQFFEWYNDGFEHSYHPFEEEVYAYFEGDESRYPRDDELRYRLSDVYGYVQVLKRLQQTFHTGGGAAVIAQIRAEDEWDIENLVMHWETAGYDEDTLAAYLEFLDYRNWKITVDGKEVPWFAYPPELPVDDSRIAWR